MKPFSLLFPPFLIITFLITIHGTKGHNLINSTCTTSAETNPNIDYDFCTTSLQAAPSSQCATLQELGTISIRLILYNVTDTSCQIKQMLKNKNLDPYVRQCLDDCFELYSDSIPSVEQAIKDYDNKRFDDANIQISSVMEAATTCEEGFKEKKGVVSLLTKRNNDTFELSAIALSIMNMIQKGSG